MSFQRRWLRGKPSVLGARWGPRTRGLRLTPASSPRGSGPASLSEDRKDPAGVPSACRVGAAINAFPLWPFLRHRTVRVGVSQSSRNWFSFGSMECSGRSRSSALGSCRPAPPHPCLPLHPYHPAPPTPPRGPRRGRGAARRARQHTTRGSPALGRARRCERWTSDW